MRNDGLREVCSPAICTMSIPGINRIKALSNASVGESPRVQVGLVYIAVAQRVVEWKGNPVPGGITGSPCR
jgi:hypothetical protein